MADQPIDPRIALLDQTWNDPKSRRLLAEAIKIARPDLDIPGLDMAKAAEAFEQKANERDAAFDAKVQKWNAERAHEKAVDGLKSQKYSDADITAIEKIMAEEGVGTHDNAARLYDMRREVGKPRTPTDYSGGMTPRAYQRGQHAAYFNGIMDGPFHNPGEEWGRSKADQILRDFQTNRAEAEVKWSDQDYWPADPNFPLKTA